MDSISRSISLSIYRRKYHIAHRDEVRSRKNRLRRERLAWIDKYKAKRGCVDCGESDPVCLDLDHREPERKVDGLGKMVDAGFSMERIKAEVDKCEVRCSNCHRKRHAIERRVALLALTQTTQQ